MSVENSTSGLRILKLNGHTGSCPGYALLALQNHVRMNSESESKGLLREPWQEKPGWKHTRTESLGETESERGEELKVSEVQWMCLRNPGIKNDEQVARIRGNKVKEQSDKWRKIERLEHEAPNTSASSNPCLALEYLVSRETRSRPGSVPVQEIRSCGWRISALDAFYREDGRRSRYIGELVEQWTCPNVLGKKLCRLNPKIRMEEKM